MDYLSLDASCFVLCVLAGLFNTDIIPLLEIRIIATIIFDSHFGFILSMPIVDFLDDYNGLGDMHLPIENPILPNKHLLFLIFVIARCERRFGTHRVLLFLSQVYQMGLV